MKEGLIKSRISPASCSKPNSETEKGQSLPVLLQQPAGCSLLTHKRWPVPSLLGGGLGGSSGCDSWVYRSWSWKASVGGGLRTPGAWELCSHAISWWFSEDNDQGSLLLDQNVISQACISCLPVYFGFLNLCSLPGTILIFFFSCLWCDSLIFPLWGWLPSYTLKMSTSLNGACRKRQLRWFHMWCLCAGLTCVWQDDKASPLRGRK